MRKIDWFSRLPNKRPACTATRQVAGGIGVATILLMTGIVLAQGPTLSSDGSTNTLQTIPVVQNGYVVHQSVDLGGHVAGIFGSKDMYDTLINIQSGPRVLGETFTLHAVPGSKHPLLDSLTAFSSGFGGDPNNFVKMDFSKGKLYEFSGMFRRDRQYFDYDLLGNALIPGGQSVPIGPGGLLGSYAWPQMNQTPFKFNTVRRMTDTNLTIFPLSKVTFRIAYSQNIFQGPTLSPGGYNVGVFGMLLQENLRNSNDDFIGAVDWKPLQQTKFTLEEEVNHYKEDSYYTLAPGTLNVQEVDGTPVSLGGYNSTSPYTASSCNTNSIATPGVALTSVAGTRGLPGVDPACAVNTNYARYQPTRILYPTEVFRFQSSSIKNIATNGSFRYTEARSDLPNYNEVWNGLNGTVRTETLTGSSYAKRHDVGAEYGVTWQALNKLSFSDQFYFSNVHEPGNTKLTEVSQSTPTTVGSETINYAGKLTTGTANIAGITNGVLVYGYFGQKILTNNLTATLDATSRATVSLTYRYSTDTIVQGNAVSTNPANTNWTIFENGGILNVALRPTVHWDVNGTVEAIYDNNVLTPIDPREAQHYRMHSLYRPKPWATISAAFNDLERHNNTNNSGDWSAQAGGVYIGPGHPPTASGIADGPIAHVDHSRIVSMGVVVAPSERYGLDLNYAYSDVFTSTNICYDATASITLPGAATASGTACSGATVRGTKYYEFGPVSDFMDAPTQYASVGLLLSPVGSVHGSLGYRISSVSGNQFFNDAQAVNGSLQSAYQSPYVNVAWTVHPGWVWRAEYNYYGYGEGGPSGAPYCSTTNPTPSSPVTVVPCNSTSLSGPTGLTEPSSGLSAPRNFHASLLTLSMHYEF
jgi:hypothetical protein